MTPHNRARLLAAGCGLALLAAALPAVLGARSLALGVLCGGLWNLASLWCLMHLLEAWLGPQPSRRQVLAWLLVKFGLLYALAFVILRQPRQYADFGRGQPAVSLIGFGIGFTVILAGAIVAIARETGRMTIARAHGR